MMPYIHIGTIHIAGREWHITLASFGLCVGMAMIVAYFALARDFRRRAMTAPADLMIAVPCIAGLVGAKLYHVLETPRALLADPGMLVSQFGFAWFGGLIGGLLAFILLARKYKIPLLHLFDAASPAAALGYGLGRIGCLISGDGDYGKPTSLPWGMSFPHGLVPTTQRVHPTPIYELIGAVIIFWWLWRIGGKQAAAQMASLKKTRGAAAAPAGSVARNGYVFAQYLLWTGLARFLVEFIRINPRSVFGIFSNAQTVAGISAIVGAAMIWRFHKEAQAQSSA